MIGVEGVMGARLKLSSIDGERDVDIFDGLIFGRTVDFHSNDFELSRTQRTFVN